MTEQKFRDCGLKVGPAVMLADFAKECKKKKKRAFSSYRSLEEVLEKYGIKSSSITSIPQFTPVPTQSMKNLQSLSSALMTFFVG
ncbi:unnamed protein product [Rhizophagus irregularis]|nr:unnamed protein product [Rhizophagus irregularis]